MGRETKLSDVKVVLSGQFPENEELEQEGLATRGSEYCIPKNRDYIYLYADEPCIEACQRLYDLNIQTSASNGHYDKDFSIEQEAYIVFMYDTLSDENKNIANQLLNDGLLTSSINYSGETRLSINIPITQKSLVGDISDRFLEIVNLFQQQDVLYGRLTYDEILNKYFPKQDNGLYLDGILHDRISEEDIPERLKEWQDEGFIPAYYDGKEHYYLTEDLLNKHIDYVKTQSKSKD